MVSGMVILSSLWLVGEDLPTSPYLFPRHSDYSMFFFFRDAESSSVTTCFGDISVTSMYSVPLICLCSEIPIPTSIASANCERIILANSTTPLSPQSSPRVSPPVNHPCYSQSSQVLNSILMVHCLLIIPSDPRIMRIRVVSKSY